VKHPPAALDYLEDRLRELDDGGLLRARHPPVATVGLTFCSNDYLGLAGRHAPAAASGAGASRLIVGERPEHVHLERRLADWLGTPAAILFSSGYAANLGTVAALAESGDLIISDELNHASIIDGCRLSRATVTVVRHLDVEATIRALTQPRTGRAWVVTESYFSMDGDSPDLRRLRQACDANGAALVVDEAHALGVFGPRGRGLCAGLGVTPDVLVGTLGKSFGAAGAFVAGREALISWLWNRARPFVFSTGLSPSVASAAAASLDLVADDEPRRARLLRSATSLRDGLRKLGLPTRGTGPIIPLIVGDPRRAVEAAARLRTLGVHVQAVRPPTVPAGTARLRVTVTALHSEADIAFALSAFEQVRPWLAPSY
jgi:8-amino-7-oxononanoate synthase